MLTMLSAMGAGPVWAQDSAAPQRARTLYDAAVKELDASGPTSACPMFEEVITLAPESVGGWTMLGECRKRQGRLASAFQAYTQAAGVAARLGQPLRSEKAARLAAAIEPRLARIVLVLSDGARQSPGLEVRLDGQSVAPEELDAALPVDRGDHVIEVRADGKRPLELRQRVEFDAAVVSVRVDELLPVAPDPAPKPEAPDAPPSAALGKAQRGPAAPIAHVEASPPPARDWRRTAGIAAAAVGGAGLVAGSVAGIVAITRRDASNDGHCRRNVCDDEGIALREASLLAGNLSTGLFVAGGVLAAAGVTLVLLPARRDSAARLLIGPGHAGVRAAF